MVAAEFLNTLMVDTQRRHHHALLFLLEVLAAVDRLGEAAKAIYPGLDATSAHLYYLFHAVGRDPRLYASRTGDLVTAREQLQSAVAAATIAVLFVSVASLRLTMLARFTMGSSLFGPETCGPKTFDFISA